MAEHEAKLAYLQKLSTEVAMPHWDWAERIHKAPSVLFLLDPIGQREIVELAQCFGFQWRAVAVSTDAYLQYQSGEYYDNLTHADADEACLRVLKEPSDVVVVSGSVWTVVSGGVRAWVLECVRGGGTLVYLGCPRGWNAGDELWHALGVAGAREWQRAVPAGAGKGALACWPEASPPIHVHEVTLAGGQVLAEARTADGGLLPLVAGNRYGAGRTLYVAYMSEAQTAEVRGAGLTPFLAFREVENLMFPYWAYLLASVMKWVATAGQPERWRVAEISVLVDGARVYGMVRHVAAVPQLVARWTWRDEAGDVVGEGETALSEGAEETTISGPFLTGLPADQEFLDVVLGTPAGALDWAAVSTGPRGPRLSIERDRAVYPRGTTVAGSICVTGVEGPLGARRPFRLTLSLRDCYGWGWERQHCALAADQRAGAGPHEQAEVVFEFRSARHMTTGRDGVRPAWRPGRPRDRGNQTESRDFRGP